jgi:hypothetical protein
MELDDSTKQHRVAILRVTKQRSAIKAITWRIIGTADTFAISWLITKEPVTAGAIASSITNLQRLRRDRIQAEAARLMRSYPTFLSKD